MSYYVLIRGPAGVGKSTVSALLASRIGTTVTHFDKVLEELGIDEVVEDKWIPLDRFLKADDAALPRVRKELESGRNAVMDGNFYHREQIDDIVGRLEFPHFAFTLKADLGECVKRDVRRKDALGEKGIEAVFGLVSAFDYGKVIRTDNKAPRDVVEDVMKVLPK